MTASEEMTQAELIMWIAESLSRIADAAEEIATHLDNVVQASSYSGKERFHLRVLDIGRDG